MAVRKVLKQETAPFANPRDRIVIDCADLDIPGPAAIKLCLIIHEFATNAAKYDLVHASRRARHWAARDGETIVITWNERGGAPLPSRILPAGVSAPCLSPAWSRTWAVAGSALCALRTASTSA